MALLPVDGSRVISGIFSIPLTTSDQSTTGASRFVAGPENALVRVLAEAVTAETVAYNPIVLVGGSGLGKTLLLQALADRRLAAWPSLSVVSLSAADFARGHHDAIETKSVEEWRGQHLRAGLVVLDDVHRLVGKPAAQSELITLLDTLGRRGSLVLAAMRRQPTEIRGLAPALASRLSRGLIVPLALPELAARRAIVEQLTQQLAMPLPADVIDRLAKSANGRRTVLATPLQLRHAVMQLAHQAESSANIDVQQVDALVTEHTPETKGAMRQAAALVAKHFQLPLPDLKSQSRQQTVVRARSLAMHLCRETTGASYAEIGRYFGNRDHTTVMHACRKIATQLLDDAPLRELADDLATQLALTSE